MQGEGAQARASLGSRGGPECLDRLGDGQRKRVERQPPALQPAQAPRPVASRRRPRPATRPCSGSPHAGAVGHQRTLGVDTIARSISGITSSRRCSTTTSVWRPRARSSPSRAISIGRASGVELGCRLVQHDDLRLQNRTQASARRCFWPPDSRSIRSWRRWPARPPPAPTRSDLHLVARDGQVFEAEGDLVLDGEHTELRLGVLEDDPDPLGELAHRGAPCVEAVDAHRPAQVARDSVRDRSVQAEREGALAAAARAEHQH